MSSNTKNYLFMLIIIAVVLVVTLVGGPNENLLYVHEDKLEIAGVDEVTYGVDYSDIKSIEFVQPLPDLGEEVSVVTKGKSVCGTYQNGEYGDCRVMVSQRIDACIVLKTAEETILFNTESSETTQELARALGEHLETME